MNFKNITEVEEVSEIKETDKVILNVDGKAKQANANLIKPKEEERLYIKAELKTTEAGPDGSGSVKKYYSLIESNLKYEPLVAKFKNHDYPPVALEMQIQPGFFINARTYGISADAATVPGASSTMEGWVLYYDSLLLTQLAGLPVVLVKPDDTIEFQEF